MSNKSLIGVYISTALARSFLNVDVLLPLMRQAAVTELGGVDHVEDPNGTHPASGNRLFKMRDEKMHRVYMPLTCATKLCDFIVPARLACKVAGYLADIIPTYSTSEPWYLAHKILIMTYLSFFFSSSRNAQVHTRPRGLRCQRTQDPEGIVAIHFRFPQLSFLIIKETYADWTLQILGLIEQCGDLVIQIQTSGCLVNSFTRSSFIPDEVVQVCSTHPSILHPLTALIGYKNYHSFA